MNDAPKTQLTSGQAFEAIAAANSPAPPDTNAAEQNPHLPPPSVNSGTNGVAHSQRNDGSPSNEKSDSEAETVVLPGKEEDEGPKSKKAIKLEETDSDSDVETLNLQTNDNMQPDIQEKTRTRRLSLKRKRGKEEPQHDEFRENRDSSNLSSTVSSPVIGRRSSKESDTKSNRSQSSPPFDEAVPQPRGSPSGEKEGQNNGQKTRRQGKNDHASGHVNGRKRRDTRSATHFDDSTPRSESPPSRISNRAHSIQSEFSHPRGVTKRRKTPAPLHVDRRRKPSEDFHADSDDSSSVHSHSRKQKLMSTDGTAMSPAKVSHKKNRDRNGRTLLARACAGDVKEAERWVRDRPQDLNVPDNAGNTPLQIASLEGDVEIVRLLLDSGCDTTCKNIDSDTPLIDAVENGHLEVVQLLLKAGLDPRQSNAKGQEPLELVKPDLEDSEEIRAALQASKKEKDTNRRQSEDHSRQHRSRDPDMVSATAAGPSPTHSTRSPPLDPSAKRRTARSQPTNDSLLWVNPTRERLRDAAGKGDLTIVNYILNMRPEADTEAVIAAARGGHETILGLILAIAQPEQDPEPLRSGDHKPGYTTPMLAAIGRGNIAVINLLLDQPGFDPTRRLYKGLTYFELAKERQSSEWQEEYDVLKEAYDDYKKHGGRKSKDSSPRKGRAKRGDSKKPTPEPSSSPHEPRKFRKSNHPPVKEESDVEAKVEAKRKTLYKETALKQRRGEHELTGHDNESLGPPKSKIAEKRSMSDVTSAVSGRPEGSKPKRKLMSGNDFKTGQVEKRRASLAAETPSTTNHDHLRRKSGESVSSHDDTRRRSSDASVSARSAKDATPEESTRTKGEPGKKRLRISVSPQASRTDMNDIIKKKKRQRIDSHGTAVDQDRDWPPRPGPAMVANMIGGPTAVASPSVPQGTAPVAFMGNSIAPSVTKSPSDEQARSAVISPATSIDQALQPATTPLDPQAQKEADDELLRQQQAQEREQQQNLEEERLALVDAEERQKAVAQQELVARAARVEADRQALIAREEEEARLEVQRQADEAQRRIQAEREEAEALLAKKRKEEEMQRRRAEQERQRKEDQERRRREAEERETMRRIRGQQEEERLRRESLPNGLRRLAELSPDEARREVSRWLPLKTVFTKQIDPGCDAQVAEERWLANVQAAPLLVNKDLELSQCKWMRQGIMYDICKKSNNPYRHSLDPPPHIATPSRQLVAYPSQSHGSGHSWCYHQPHGCLPPRQ